MDFEISGVPTIELADAGYALTLTQSDDPTAPLTNRMGEPLVITVAGQDSKRYRDGTRSNLNARLQAAPGVARRNPTAEELESSGLRVTVKCVLGWSGFVDKDGKPIDCTPAAVMDLFVKYPFIKDQVEGAMLNRANFTPKSPTT